MKIAASQVVAQSPVAFSLVRPAPPIVTIAIIGANVLVYLGMGLSGASWVEPSIQHALKWGADFGPLTLSGQWWRLFTSTFVHFGIIHIGFNMWCFWNLGQSLEPLMGRKAFSVMYVASGLAASLVSVAWNPWRVSAGASGAIFGVAGALVSYLALKKTSLDRTLVRQNLKSLGLFIGYNLLRGLGGAVDNSAHLGGLVAGLILGAVTPRMTSTLPAAGGVNQPAPIVSGVPLGADASSESRENRIAWTIAICSAVVLLLGAVAAHAKNITAARYGKAVELVRSGHPDDAVAEMQQVIKLDPEFLFGQALLGELLLDQQNPSAAAPVLEQAASLAPNAFDVEHNLALAYLGSGEPTSALQQITKALASEKNDPWRGEYILGLAREESGEYGPAAQDLRSVIQAKPDFYEAQNALARAEIEQGRIDDARALYGSVLKINPQDSAAASGIALLAAGGNPHPAASQLPPVTIPYSKLVMKSEYWPLYP